MSTNSAIMTRRYVRSNPFVFSYSEADGYTDVYDGEIRTISFLTSGILTVDSNATIDVFLVGGGGGGGYSQGGGGGGGYTLTKRGLTLFAGNTYKIIIGDGGTGSSSATESGGDGGTTSAFGLSANGGTGGGSYSTSPQRQGGDGGSGGGGGAAAGKQGGHGGSNGGLGTQGTASGAYGQGGSGQGSTTRAFGEFRGQIFSGGGGGSTSGTPGYGGTGGGADGGAKDGTIYHGAPNTGGGGGGGGYSGTKNYAGGDGGSGIVMIRIRQTEEEYPTVLDIYNRGDKCTHATGGWMSFCKAGMEIVFGKQTLNINIISSSNRYMTMWTRSAIDVSQYASLKVAFLSVTNKGSSAYPLMFSMVDQMDVLSTTAADAYNNIGNPTVVSESIVRTGGEYVYEYVLPEDAQNKMKYFQIVCESTGAEISRIWLE